MKCRKILTLLVFLYRDYLRRNLKTPFPIWERFFEFPAFHHYVQNENWEGKNQKEIRTEIKSRIRKYIKPEIAENNYCVCKVLSRLSQEESDYLMTEYCKFDTSLRIVTIYPLAQKYLKTIVPILNNHGSILYQKTIELNQTLMKNIIWNYYIREDRMGKIPEESDFWLDKVNRTFPRSDQNKMTIFVFKPSLSSRKTGTSGEIREKSREEIREMKEKIRHICKYGFHSIHINDSHRETIQMSRLVLSSPSLLRANEKFYKASKTKLLAFFAFWKKFRKMPIVDQESIIVDLSYLYSKKGQLEYEVASYADRDAIASRLGLEPRKKTFTDREIADPRSNFYWFGIKSYLPNQ